MKESKVWYKKRLAGSDVHYGGGLVDGAKILELFGDAATELLIREEGDEGLFRAYEKVEFLAPVYAGDFIEVEACLIKKGESSRTINFVARKIIRGSRDLKKPSKAILLKEPIVVAKAVGTCVVHKSVHS